MISAQYKAAVAWVIRLGAYIIPFIPLYIASDLFFPFITGKAFAFRIIVEIVFAAWVWLILVAPEHRPRKSQLLIAFTVFLAVLTLSTIFSENLTRSFWSNFERMEGLVMHLHLFAYFLVLSSMFERKHWHTFFALFVVAGFFENIYVMIQHLGYIPSLQGITRVDGTIGNPTYLAAYLLFVVGFSLLMRLWSQGSPWRYWYDFMAVFSLIAMYFTASRGISVGLLGGILVFVMFVLWPRASHIVALRYRYGAFGLFVVAMLCAGGLYVFRSSAFVLNSPVLSRVASISLAQGAARFKIWAIGWRGFQDYPIIGRGLETYANVFSRYYNPALYNQEPWFDRSHNIILDWLNSAGVAGLFSYLALLGAALVCLLRLVRKNAITLLEGGLLTALLAAYVIQNLFVFDQLATYVSLVALFAYLASTERVVSGAVASSAKLFVPELKVMSAAIAGFVLVASLATTFYFINVKPIRANLALIDALRRASVGDLLGTVAAYADALDEGPLGRQEIREQLTRFGVAFAGATNIPDDQKLLALQTILGEAQKNVAENPLDPRGVIYLATFLNRVGLTDAAIQALDRALVLSPKKQQIYFEKAESYFQKNDYVHAIPVLRAAFDLDTRFDTARQNLIAAYILSGDQKNADVLLLEGYGRLDPPIDLFAAVYTRAANYVRLEGITRSLVANIPANTGYRINLAKLLVGLGRRTEAILSLREAIQAIPTFATEGGSLIEKIQKGEAI